MDVRESIQSDIEYAMANPVDGGAEKYKFFPINGWTRTGLVDGKIVAVGGMVKYWEGVGEGWIYMTKHANEHPIETMRILREMVALGMKEFGLWRLEAKARADFPKAQQMLIHLGFSCEGSKHKYNPDGSDSWSYAKVIE